MKSKIVVGLLLIAAWGYPTPLSNSFMAACDGQLRIIGSTNVSSFMLTAPISHSLCYIGHPDETCTLEVKIPLKGFQADLPLMEKDFLEMMKYTKYPFISLRFIMVPSDLKPGQSDETVRVGILGQEIDYSVRLATRINDESGYWELTGLHEINLPDLGISPPEKMFGLIKVREKISISFALRIDFRNQLICNNEVQYKSKIRP